MKSKCDQKTETKLRKSNVYHRTVDEEMKSIHAKTCFELYFTLELETVTNIL